MGLVALQRAVSERHLPQPGDEIGPGGGLQALDHLLGHRGIESGSGRQVPASPQMTFDRFQLLDRQ
jgi:hypothetical protein